MIRSRAAHLLLFAAVFSFVACSDDEITSPSDSEQADTTSATPDTAFATPDWTTATHSNDVDPDFDEVFEDNTVKRLDIVIAEQRWDSMLVNMTDLYGTFGTGGGPLADTENPDWFPAEVFYNGIQWYRVGIRFKGNSSLQTSWQRGILKLSFKLDFDEFEDAYPQIDNQRFYGFKQYSLKNNFEDPSFMREKVAGDVFRKAGLVASHTAFYELYVDYGDGPVYFGLYTMVEEVDDTVIDTQFADNDGNLYKPEGDGASFASGTFSEDSFEKETNEDEADWSDVLSLFAVLQDDSRTTDAASWRANLDAVFDTDVFLQYLAVNTVIQNWDTYGRMTQNYFLYNDPDTEMLTWIPWDNNEALQVGKGGGSLALDFSDLAGGGSWPLIEYLYDDATYRAQYDAYVEDVIDGVFETSFVQATYSAYASLLEPYASAEAAPFTFLNSSGDFQTAVAGLRSHASSRASAVSSYLSR